MTYTIVEDHNTLPAALLVPAKAHMRVDFPDDDATITMYLQWAIDYRQRFLGQQIFGSTVSWVPGDSASRYQCPTQPISAFTVLSNAVDVSDEYALEAMSAIEPVWLVHLDGSNFPTDAAVSLQAGFAAAADLWPAEQGNILRIAATLYEHRESVSVIGPEEIPYWLNDALGGLWVPRA